ncbi:long-chain-fatty-acid-CoA ligase [Geomicrobium sp. JCM 19055]|nr:long-chain-fatty-acid-CoA ligase [Geomicrobium sp. JCM 19055]
MALLEFAKRTYRHAPMVRSDGVVWSFEDLHEKVLITARKLSNHEVDIKSGDRVALVVTNNTSFTTLLFACTSIGADVFLMNPSLSTKQLHAFCTENNIKAIIHDSTYSFTDNVAALTVQEIEQTKAAKKRPGRARVNRVIIPSGGSTGKAKAIAHKPSLTNYLAPFRACITTLNMKHHQHAYIATPMYHGYGFAVFLLCVAAGKEVIVDERFNANLVMKRMTDHNVHLLIVTPTMLHDLVQVKSPKKLTIQCIASGGAPLNEPLIQRATELFGPVVHNLFGTTETGLNFIATPNDLRQDPRALGKPIKGMKARVVDTRGKVANSQETGSLQILTKSGMEKAKQSWYSTGDLVVKDEKGRYYSRGREDEQILSGGISVYPIELEQLLHEHEQVERVAVVGIPDERFGERLHAFVEPKVSALTEEELRRWLKEQARRELMPKKITFRSQLPYEQTGKVNKKNLRD